MYGALALMTLIAHLGFVLFCVFGGLLGLRHSRWLWVHLPVLVWGAAIEFGGFICPLTYLENYFLRQAGEAGYSGDFIARYLLALIYPEGLERSDQLILGVALLVFNGLVYGLVWRRSNRF